MKTSIFRVAVPFALFAFVFSSNSQIAPATPTNQSASYVCFDLHQHTFVETTSASIANEQGVGAGAIYGVITFSAYHALLWPCGRNDAVDLNPSGFADSWAQGASGTQQVGFGAGPVTGSFYHALLWSGSANSVVDLNPAGYSASQAYAICGSQEVGYGWNSNAMAIHALIWFGSASNVLDIHPAGFTHSYAYGTSGAQQVGFGDGPAPDYNEHALLWSGTAASAVDLNPAGFTLSQAFGISGTQQAGLGYGPITGNNVHALLWSGTASSAVDLTPSGCTASVCWGNNGNHQLGGASGPATGNNEHAMLWSGTPDSAVDLHRFLSSEYSSSVADTMDANGNIAGEASYVPSGGYLHAIEWVPLPNSIVISNDPGLCGAVWTLPNCAISSMCSPPSGTFLPIGTNLITCTITNSATTNAPIVHTFTVTVKDCEPPTIQAVTANPPVLWPPDNQIQPVAVNVSATDNCHVSGSKIISVMSNESDRNSDWQITGDLTVNLRASRSGTGAGRIYTITVQCTDDSGNASTNTVTVTVPRSQGSV